MSETNTANIKHVIAIMGAKGGVGRSAVTGVLAVALQRQGLRVGILDGDLAALSIGFMFGVNEQPISYSDEGLEPATSESGIKIVSVNVAMSEDEPLDWRGPMVSSAFKQFYSEVDWGALDYLLVDVPAGTADVPMSVFQSLPLQGCIIVSSPQSQAVRVARKSITMALQHKSPLLGIVENMAYFIDSGGEYHTIFGPSRASELTAFSGAPLLAQLPLDAQLAAFIDAGRIEEYESGATKSLATHVLDALTASIR
ncbi:MAG TPA: P-loop NTPase [Ktedonobacteraceae bacterium]|nr:P-loop NTPase [Ktedonobacteraceae bacterium]